MLSKLTHSVLPMDHGRCKCRSWRALGGFSAVLASAGERGCPGAEADHPSIPSGRAIAWVMGVRQLRRVEHLLPPLRPRKLVTRNAWTAATMQGLQALLRLLLGQPGCALVQTSFVVADGEGMGLDRSG